MKLNEDELLYDILDHNNKAKISNEEALRDFYWQMYGISLPDLDGCLSIQTVLRKIRKLKEIYPKLKGSKDIQEAKEDEQCKYKEIAREAPKIEEQKIEEIKIEGVYW